MRGRIWQAAAILAVLPRVLAGRTEPTDAWFHIQAYRKTWPYDDGRWHLRPPDCELCRPPDREAQSEAGAGHGGGALSQTSESVSRRRLRDLGEALSSGGLSILFRESGATKAATEGETT